MKAVVYHRYGAPDVLEVQERDKPSPKDREVLIRVRATEVTKTDCELRSFTFPVQWYWLPLRLAMGLTKPRRNILGAYFAGEVEAIGGGVVRFKPGDRIFGSARLRMGAYGEYMRLPDRYTLAPMPRNSSFEEAAAVPLGGLNALHFLKKAKIQTGEKVLVNGAGGSIGVYGVQIAKAMGAEVTAIDAAHKEPMLRSIGAAHFFDYARPDFAQSPTTYDVILNMVAAGAYAGFIHRLNPKGRYLLANPRLSDMLRAVLTSARTDKATFFAFAEETEAELLELKNMIEAGAIRPVVDAIYPLDQAAAAHRRVESEQRLGPVVLSLS